MQYAGLPILLHDSEALDTLAGSSMEAQGFPYALAACDPWNLLARFCQKHRGHCHHQSSQNQDIITKRRNSLFGYVVRLDDHTLAHHAESQVAEVRTGSCLYTS